LTGVGVYSELDSLLREYGFVLWRLNEQTHYKLEGSEGALWSIERIAPSGHDPLELGVPSGPICRANVQYIRREIIAVGSQPSWTDCLRRAIVMNALCIHDAAWISLQRLLDDHPPRDVSADVWRIVGARPEVRAQPEVNAPRAVDHTEQAGDGEKSAPTDDQGAPNGQSEAAASPLASGPGLHHGRSLVELLASAARRPYHPVVWRLDRNYARGLERLDAIAARLDRLDAITARLGPIEARLAAVERRLQESSRRERDGLGASREAIRSAEQLMREVRLANDASREEIADWCAVIARELDRDRVDER
jgi:hypothetical protein